MRTPPPGLGPTGDFPHGKIDETDEGGLTIAITCDGENVMIHFGKEVSWIGFPTDMAVEFAVSVLKFAGAKTIEINMGKDG